MNNGQPTPEQLRAVADKLSHNFADEGKLVEAGWVGFKLQVLPKDAPLEQVEAMRIAFFSGASHLFASMLVILDPSSKPVERDMNRMSMIYAEIDNFQKSFGPKEPAADEHK